MCIYARVRVFRHLETAKGNRKGDGLLRESYVERKLTTEAKKRGGLAVKFVSPGFDGVPDRLVLFPGGKVAFVELKAPGEKPRKLQQVRIKQLRKMGFMCFVVDGLEMISDVLDSIKGGVS